MRRISTVRRERPQAPSAQKRARAQAAGAQGARDRRTDPRRDGPAPEGAGARTALARTLTDLGIKNGMSTGDYEEDWRRFLKLSSRPPYAAAAEGEGKRVAFVAPEGMYAPALRGHGILAGPCGPAAQSARSSRATERFRRARRRACSTTGTPAEFLGMARPKLCGTCYANVQRTFDAFWTAAGCRERLQFAHAPARSLGRRGALSGRAARRILAYERNDVALGQVVETSLYRYFLRGTLPDTDEVRAVARRYLRAGVEVAGMMERFVDDWRPDVIVSQCGLYLIGGTVTGGGQGPRRGAVAWEVGYRRGSVLASHKGSYVREMRFDATRLLGPSTHSAKSRALDIYLDGRQRGAMDDSDPSSLAHRGPGGRAGGHGTARRESGWSPCSPTSSGTPRSMRRRRCSAARSTG